MKVQDFYLERVRDPYEASKMKPELIANQKAIKLFHSAWSGITKYMRTICMGKGKAVELNDIGIFVPIKIVNGTGGR